MRAFLRRLHCKLLDHDYECSVTVFLLDKGDDVQRHRHYCYRCDSVVLEEYEPVTPGMRNMLGDMLQLDSTADEPTAWVN